jgi:hypothetical protein
MPNTALEEGTIITFYEYSLTTGTEIQVMSSTAYVQSCTKHRTLIE